jgi:hypothetical protein
MTSEEILSLTLLKGVGARNGAAKLTDPADLYTLLRAEREGKNRLIVTGAVQGRLRSLGHPDEPPVVPEKKQGRKRSALSGDEITSGTCCRCGKPAHTHAEVEKVFGFRAMPGPDGVKVIRRQPRCKPCRSGKNGRRAAEVTDG